MEYKFTQDGEKVKMDTQQEKIKADCILAVTKETLPTGNYIWVVWKNEQVIAEELSEAAALAIARAIIIG